MVLLLLHALALLSCWRTGGSRASTASCSTVVISGFDTTQLKNHCVAIDIRQQRAKFKIVAFRVLQLDLMKVQKTKYLELEFTKL
jgi:hypothetical protein